MLETEAWVVGEGHPIHGQSPRTELTAKIRVNQESKSGRTRGHSQSTGAVGARVMMSKSRKHGGDTRVLAWTQYYWLGLAFKAWSMWVLCPASSGD